MGSVAYMFDGCSSLSAKVRFTEPDLNDAYAFAQGNKTPATVYVPKNSQTANTFRSTSTANVIVVEE